MVASSASATFRTPTAEEIDRRRARIAAGWSADQRRRRSHRAAVQMRVLWSMLDPDAYARQF